LREADRVAAGRILVLGGQRTGKSRYAEELVLAGGNAPVYLATTAHDTSDTDMAGRIALHRARRDGRWRTVEEPLDLAAALSREAGDGFHVLVECLTVWLSNLMMAERDIEAETVRVCEALAVVRGDVTLVSGEVGLGVIADNALARRYADALGVMNQQIAAVADRVVLVAAGLPLVLKAAQSNSEATEI
jgi:adenosylcobinamide kinase/adenosylcobinamide-phosphate guanylyltransferase